MILKLSVLVTLLMADTVWSQCKTANWRGVFDKKGWAKCDSSKHYITGLWRNNNKGSNDKISLLEEAKCCPAPSPNQKTASKCKTADWRGVLDKAKSWAVCPDGFFVQGFFRGSGDWLHHIKEAKCCKPETFRNRYEHCYNEDISSSFDNIGLSKCKKTDYYVAGIYRGGCDKLYCLEKLKCCKMNVDECSPDPCQNGGTCVDLVGSYRCDCRTGYSGNNCETNINDCSPDPCQNGGTCVDLVGSYLCDCQTGYSGKNCETDINECAPAPCINGGTCVDLIGNYRCDCATGWLGDTCNEPEMEECVE